MTFAYPADSGQDYAIIEEAGGMRSRVVDDGKGGWRLVDNAGYRGALRAERIAARLRLRVVTPPPMTQRLSPRLRADPLFLRRDDDEEFDHEGVSRPGRSASGSTAP